jgi:hypothetical protein
MKKFVVEVGDSDKEEEIGRIKWKDFKVHHLIAIHGEMDDEFTETTNKQGELVFFF